MAIDQQDLLRKLEATIASWNDEVTHAQSQLSDQIADTRSQLVTLVRLLASRTENGGALTEALDDIQNLQSELKSREVTAPPPDSSRLHEELRGLRNSIEGFHERDRQTEELNRDLEGRLAELRTREEMNEDALAQARRELEELRGTLNERDETVRTATDNTSSLSHTLSLLQKEFESLRGAAEQATENDATVRNELNALRTAIEERLSQPSEPSADIGSLTEQIADAARKEQSLQADLDALRGELRQRTGDLAQAQAERDEASAESLRVQDELREVAEALASVEKELASVEDELGALRQSIVEKVDAEADLSGDLEKLKAAHEEMEAQLAKAREENLALEGRLEGAQSSQAAAEERLSEFSEDHEASSKALAQAEEYLLSAETDTTESVKKQEALSAELAGLSGQIEEKSAELERYRSDLDGLREQLGGKESENLRLLEELDLVRSAADLSRSSDALSALIAEGSSGEALEERKAELLTYEAYLIEREALLANAIEELRGQIESAEEEPVGAESLRRLRSKAEYLKATALDIGKDEFGRLLLDDADRPERAERWGDLLCRAGLISGEEKLLCFASRESGSPNPLGKLLGEKNITREDVLHRILFALGEAAPAREADARELEEAKEEAKRYREIANQANIEAGEARALVREREETIVRLNETVADRDRALDSIQGDLQALQQSHAQEFARDEEKLGAAQSEAGRLESELARRDGELEALQAEMDKLTERLTLMEDELASRGEEIATLRTTLVETENRVQELAASDKSGAEEEKAQREAIEEERTALEAYKTELSDTLAKRDNELAEQRSELEALREETEALNERLAPMESELASRDEEMASLRAELSTAEGRVEELSAPGETAVQEANAQLAAVEDERARLESKVAGLSDTLAKRDTDAEELRAQLAPAQAELDERKEELERLKEKLSAAEGQVAELVEELSATQHAVAASEDALAVAGAEEMAALEDKLGALAILIEERDSELAALKRELEEVSKTPDPAAMQISRATPERAWGVDDPEPDDPIAKAAYDESGRKRSMGEILVEAGTLTEDQLDTALAEQRSSSRRRLGTIIVENGWATEEAVSQVLAGQLRMPFVRLPGEVIELYAADLIDGKFATHHMCMPIRVEGNAMVVAMANPLDLIAIEDIERRTDLTARPVVATLADITAAIVKYYGATFENGDAPTGA